MNRHIGVELEFADINTRFASKLIHDLFGYDFSEWSDEIENIFNNSHSFDYSKWNCVSDPAIHNSDGSVCANSFYENHVLVEARRSNKEHQQKWSGIEVMSPKTNDYKKLLVDIQNIINALRSNGAAIGKHLDTSLHIHVDASDLPFRILRNVPLMAINIQDKLQIFSTDVKNPLYSMDVAQEISLCSDADAALKVFSGNIYSKSLTHKLAYMRRSINIHPYLVRERPNRTIEFRPYTMTMNTDHIAACIDLSLVVFDYLIGKADMKTVDALVEKAISTNKQDAF